MRRLLLTLLGYLGACTSLQSTAVRYQELGQHELASYYWVQAARDAPDDTATRQALLQSMEYALKDLQLQFERALNADAPKAMGVALRKAEILSLAKTQGLNELAAYSAQPELAMAMTRLQKFTLAAADRLATAQENPKELLGALRFALALDPHNAELAARYERQRLTLLRHLDIRPQCAPETASLCEAFAGRLLQRLTGASLEVTTLARTHAPRVTLSLEVELRTTLATTPFTPSHQRKREAQVMRMNRFKEPELDADGNPLHDTVTAQVTIYEASANAQLEARFRLRDWRPPQVPDLVWTERDEETARKRYVTWSGDERALGELAALGTNQVPPTAAEALLTSVLDRTVVRAAEKLLHHLEGDSQ